MGAFFPFWHNVCIGLSDRVQNNNDLNENDLLFSKLHRHTRKKKIRVLLSGVEPKTFRLLVWTLYHRATEDSWALIMAIKLGSWDKHPAHCLDRNVNVCHMRDGI